MTMPANRVVGDGPVTDAACTSAVLLCPFAAIAAAAAAAAATTVTAAAAAADVSSADVPPAAAGAEIAALAGAVDPRRSSFSALCP